MTTNHFEDRIRVQVTKRLSKRDVQSIVEDFTRQGLTFAVSRLKSDYEVWREILPGDQPRIKNRKDGMSFAGIIAEDKNDLEQRNFICIWDHGNLVHGDPAEFKMK